MSFPKRGPKTLKLGLICLTKISDASSKSSISLTLTSCLIKSDTACIASFWSLEFTGIIILRNGCLTLIFSLALKDNTSEEINWASDILCSNALSIKAESTFGNSDKCTLAYGSKFEVVFKSKYKRSIKKGAMGAPSLERVSIHLNKVW